MLLMLHLTCGAPCTCFGNVDLMEWVSECTAPITDHYKQIIWGRSITKKSLNRTSRTTRDCSHTIIESLHFNINEFCLYTTLKSFLLHRHKVLLCRQHAPLYITHPAFIISKSPCYNTHTHSPSPPPPLYSPFLYSPSLYSPSLSLSPSPLLSPSFTSSWNQWFLLLRDR